MSVFLYVVFIEGITTINWASVRPLDWNFILGRVTLREKVSLHYSRVNELWIYMRSTLVIHIGQMLNTVQSWNLGPSAQYWIPLLNEDCVATFSAGSHSWHHFYPILFQVYFNVESTLYDSISMFRGNYETILIQHCKNT